MNLKCLKLFTAVTRGSSKSQIVTLNILSSVFIKFLSGNVITLVTDHHCEAAHQPIKEPDNPLFNS